MKFPLLFILLIGALLALGISFLPANLGEHNPDISVLGAATSTIVNNLYIKAQQSAGNPCLLINSNGFVSTTTCGGIYSLTAGSNLVLTSATGTPTISVTSTPSFATLWASTFNATSATIGTLNITSLAQSPFLVGGSATTTIYGNSETSIFGGGISATTGAFSATTTFPGSGIWNSTGNVGIGTTGPSVLVHGMGSNQTRFRVESTSASDSDTGYEIKDPNRMWRVGINNYGIGAGKFSIWDENALANRLTIDTTGNVGIGTTGPQSLLQIATPKDASFKYFQMDVETSAPASADCNSETQIGRMIMASTTARYLWTCWGTAGWATSSVTF